MPIKTTKNKIFFKRLFCFVFVFIFLFSALAAPMREARAQVITTSPMDTALNIGKRTGEFLKNWYNDIKKGLTGIATTKFLMKAIDKFAQNMAQKVAVGLATGAKGGKPLAFTKEMGAYLKDSADAAAGNYIENLSKDWVNNLCKPDLSLRLNYGLSLYKIEQPGKPKCTFSEMVNNWDKAVNDPNLLKNFSVSFEPEQNDMGIWLQLTGDVEREKELAKLVAERKRAIDANGGIAPKTEPISNDITTPSGKIVHISNAEVDAAIEAEKQKAVIAIKEAENPTISSILKHFFTAFGKTLANEVVKNYLAGTYSAQDASDLWKDFCDKDPDLCGKGEDSVSSSTAQNTSGGKQQAEVQYSGYIKTSLSESGNYDVLPELSSCDESKKIPGPTTCVIDSNFASAIQDKLTVSEAIEKGLLDGNKVVGYGFGGKEMTYLEGYPYRSLLILRKYRIIPVGWELAAQYYVNYGGSSQAPTLSALVDAYNDSDSPYYRLVDPNWVLKLPSGYCKASGAGPEIIFEQINPGSDVDGVIGWDGPNDLPPSKSIVRNDQYCADEQSCIKEDINGNCKYYGYCMEEKRLWKFEGEGCEDTNSTCQAFVAPDGEAVSYLKNSLDFDGCSKDNSGCQWYCNNFNKTENSLTSDGAVAFWSMDELTSGGRKVEDEIGSNDGILYGDTALASGKWGKALSFDGAGDYVRVSNNIGDDFTVALWLKTTDVGGAGQAYDGKGIVYSDFAGNANDMIPVALVGNKIGFGTGNSSGSYNTLLSSSDVNLNNWVYVVVTRVKSTGIKKVYIDGIGESVSTSVTEKLNANSNIDIGGNTLDGRYFRGLIDNVHLYNRVLTDSEIWNNYVSYNCLNNDDQIYLSDSAAVCEAEDVGCNEYLVPENGLVGYWKFDEGEDAVAYDSSGYGNDGDLKNNTSWFFGKSGQALSFDGAGDYVQMKDSLNLGDNSFTFSHWIKTTQAGVSQVYTIGNAPSADGYRFGINDTGKIQFLIGTGLADFTEAVCGATAVNDGNWHFISGVYNRGDSFECYVDGEKDGSVAIGSYIGMSDVAPGIGAPPCCTDFNGLIDEVSAYNRALSEDEIFSLYKDGINFSNKFVKAANKNLQCFGRTAGDAIFDLPVYTDSCIKLGPRYDSYGYDTCFEFLSYKNEDDCTANNGVWSSIPIKIPRHTVQSYCEKSGGVWNGAIPQCQTQCLKLDDAVCSSYAFSCKESEIGCEEYTPTQGGTPVPGVISDDDLCPAECAGYDTYKQESTNFETSKFPVNFIPKTAKSCPSNSAGCDEFTNLEAASSSGESLEYYTYLRQCEKIPTTSAGYQCGDFYTWVGSDTTGYQLQSYYLKSDSWRDLNGDAILDEEPVEILRVEENLGACKDANDALTNKNCKEFYNSKGVISYHLLKKTITCSDECASYRKTSPSEFDLEQVCKNIGGTWLVPNCNITSEEACDAISGVWTGVCSVPSIADNIFCANENYLDGVWDAVSLTCSKTDYQAIPSEGITCPAATNGCRQYTGNVGGNVMNVFNDNFESDSYIYDFPDAGRGWSNGTLSSESTDSDQKSFKVNNGLNQDITKWLSAKCSLASNCTKEDGCDCVETASLNDGVDNDEVVCRVPIDSDSCYAASYTYDKGTYLLSFWAKGNNGDDITVKITDGAKSQNFGDVTLSNQWHEFTLGPLEFAVDGWNNYQLSIEDIKSNGGTPDSALGAFFDNITLLAISDSIYVIKDSWRTPASCDRDWQGNSYLYYMLGCDEYSDTQSNLHYLKSFSSLCRADAVGCQQLIDTHNFSEPFGKTWNAGDASEVVIPSYNFTYLAQTQDYSCLQSSAGCTALGQPVFNQDKTIVKGFNEVYKINDPDQYEISLCEEENVGCQTFNSGSESYYFKDPGEQVCEYIQPTSEQNFGWYKKSKKYDINSEKCPTSDYQNLGIDFPSAVCVGGVENGKECLSGKDNQLEEECIAKGGTCNSAGVCSIGGSCLSKCSAGGGYCSNWAGACVSSQSGCSAFVDPISDSSTSFITNGLFNKDLDTDSMPDNWKNAIGTGLILPGFAPPAQEYVDAVYVDGVNVFAQEPIDIKPNATYVASVDIKRYLASADDALLQIECLNYMDGFAGCPSDKDTGFYFLDEAGELEFSGGALGCSIKLEDRAKLVIPDTKLTGDFARYSMRFFSGTCNKVQFAIGGEGATGQSFDNASLKEVGVYYYIDSSLDEAKQECNEYVNSDKGCVLLNNRDNASFKNLNFTKYLNYNVDKTISSPVSCVGTNGSRDGCNADTLMKVRPDRDCSKWLYCTDSKIVDDREVCFNVDVCDEMNENGKCISNPLEYSRRVDFENMTFDIGSIDKIKNLTGYSKVGFDWIVGGGVIEGNLPPSQMMVVGLEAGLTNGDFEVANTDYKRKPLGWDVYECSASGIACTDDSDCLAGYEVCEYSEILAKKVCRGIACDFDIDCVLGGGTCDGINWKITDFGLINNPIEQQDLGINPVSGDNFLRLTSGSSTGDGHALSEDVYVNLNTEYVISGYINTNRLTPLGEKRVYGSVRVLENNEQLVEAKIESGSNGWVYIQAPFTTKDTGKIKIKLADVADFSEYCDEDCVGAIYFDDISIRPVIATDESSLLEESYTPMSCRLFPQSEATSCEYENEDGYKYKGWYGYCLERDPVYPAYCLNWYPIEDSSGSSGQLTGESYSGKVPLYYCLEAEDPPISYLLGGWSGTDENGFITLNERPLLNVWWDDGWGALVLEDRYVFDPGDLVPDDFPKLHYGWNIITMSDHTDAPAGNTHIDATVHYTYAGEDYNLSNEVWKWNMSSLCTADSIKLDYDDSAWASIVGPYLGNSWDEADFCFRYKFYIEPKIYCKKIVRVVTDSGQNKYWATRLSTGSVYKVPDLGYSYQDDDTPFGSIIPPEPISDPEAWDSDDSTPGNQPIFVSTDAIIADPKSVPIRATHPYSCNGDCFSAWMPNYNPPVPLDATAGAEHIKRLFAKSYEIWEWNGTWESGQYIPMVAAPSWVPPVQPADRCADDERPDWPADYCGIPPKVQNLKVNGQSFAANQKVLINGSGDVSLKFNSVIDKQQLPMTSYIIEWGDTPSSITSESGTSLRDRPGISDPHAFSHEYRYTILYANKDVMPGIRCGDNCKEDPGDVLGSCADVSTSGSSFCRVQTTVEITDNWGWNSGINYGPLIYVLSNL